MSQFFTIRQGCPDDVDTLARYNIHMAKETEDLDLDPETIHMGCAAIVGDASKGKYYVAVTESGSIIGQLMITYEWSDWRNAQIWWIQSVYVVKEHRRKGVFKALYSRVKDDCRKENGCGVRLYADNSNINAQETYKNLGMTTHYAVFEDMFDD
mmetsp:Transcript_6398/g.12625  ORF Transcript_6398/g.12625 Transcript_6398/m.12625 type:complete len:154 (-) Transcript_6398:2017-2478(-)